MFVELIDPIIHVQIISEIDIFVRNEEALSLEKTKGFLFLEIINFNLRLPEQGI